jgi:hypothetical protein
MNLRELQQQLRRFAEQRNWERFHSPKNLSMALSVEAAELLEETFPLTEEIIQEQEEIYRLRAAAINGIDAKSKMARTKPVWGGPAEVSKPASRLERKKALFTKEWESALTILRSIAESIVDYEPNWMPEGTPPSWQADQFLHAYYYNKVADGPGHPFNKFYEKNRADPERARQEALEWWASLAAAPSSEDINLTDRAPTVRRLLDRKAIRELDETRLSEVLAANHSTVDHLYKIPAEHFGKTPGSKIPLDERVDLLSKSLLAACRT